MYFRRINDVVNKRPVLKQKMRLSNLYEYRKRPREREKAGEGVILY